MSKLMSGGVGLSPLGVGQGGALLLLNELLRI